MQMEPTRPMTCAILSRRRATMKETYAFMVFERTF
jgi:hypothetical protein